MTYRGWSVPIRFATPYAQAQEVIDTEICTKKAYIPVYIREFREKMPELFKFGKLEN